MNLLLVLLLSLITLVSSLAFLAPGLIISLGFSFIFCGYYKRGLLSVFLLSLIYSLLTLGSGLLSIGAFTAFSLFFCIILIQLKDFLPAVNFIILIAVTFMILISNFLMFKAFNVWHLLSALVFFYLLVHLKKYFHKRF